MGEWLPDWAAAAYLLYGLGLALILWSVFRLIDHTRNFMRYAAKIKRAEWERMEKERDE